VTLQKPLDRTAVRIPGCASSEIELRGALPHTPRLCVSLCCCLNDLILYHTRFNDLIGNDANNVSKMYRRYDETNSPISQGAISRKADSQSAVKNTHLPSVPTRSDFIRVPEIWLVHL
jgi:hypothetical protein